MGDFSYIIKKIYDGKKHFIAVGMYIQYQNNWYLFDQYLGEKSKPTELIIGLKAVQKVLEKLKKHEISNIVCMDKDIAEETFKEYIKEKDDYDRKIRHLEII